MGRVFEFTIEWNKVTNRKRNSALYKLGMVSGMTLDLKFEKIEDFYQVYDRHRTYVNANVRKKHIRNFDEQIWVPAEVKLYIQY